MMKFLVLCFAVGAMSSAQAEDKIKMSYTNEDVTKLIEVYSKATGQKFIVDANIRGKATIILPEAVTAEEAFNHLSSTLAINGYAISKQGDTMVVRSARNVQRDLIEVSTEKPSPKPERMYTWIYTVKNMPADQINRDLRILTSRDGEMSVNASTNQLIFTDWVSNLNRLSELLKEVDKPLDATSQKWVDAGKKERAATKKASLEKKEEKQ